MRFGWTTECDSRQDREAKNERPRGRAAESFHPFSLHFALTTGGSILRVSAPAGHELKRWIHGRPLAFPNTVKQGFGNQFSKSLPTRHCDDLTVYFRFR